MTPRLTAFRVAGLLLALTTGAICPSYAVSYAADPTPSAGVSRAGSSEGEGRTRPGRSAVSYTHLTLPTICSV